MYANALIRSSISSVRRGEWGVLTCADWSSMPYFQTNNVSYKLQRGIIICAFVGSIPTHEGPPCFTGYGVRLITKGCKSEPRMNHGKQDTEII